VREKIRARLAGEGGFTLVELLVTLVLMGIVMGAVTASFASAFTGETRNFASATNEENARLALDRLRMDIHCSNIANGATANPSLDGGYIFVLSEITTSAGAASCPKLGSGVDSNGEAWVSWCTIYVAPNRYRLYRETVQDCDGTAATFMVDYITRPNIWDTHQNCSPTAWQQYVGVDLITNVDPNSGQNTYEYDLHDAIGLRNSDRVYQVTGCTTIPTG
jgi:prepilin-type N-terminal cleavage/methylation domain-containing protein